MKIRITILVIALMMFASCRGRTGTLPAANNGSPSPPEAPVGGQAQTGEKFFFRGNIANLSIEMTLVRDGEQLTGTYSYPRIGKSITLTGTVDKNGNVELIEADETGKQTGIFKGRWQPQKNSPDSSLNEVEGKWSRPDGSKSTDFLVTQQPVAFTAQVSLVARTIRDSNKEQRYSIEVEYPEIQGDARFERFNREARSLVTKDVAAFKASETAEELDAGTLPEETQTSTLDTRYEYRYATDDLISVEFTESSYSRGAAHPNSLTTVLNYDVKNNRKLALGDLFSGRNYLGIISSYCLKELKDRAQKDSDSLLAEDMIDSGASPHADNYRAWAITRNGLWITFDPYQVAPYAAGPQYVLVPYSALKTIIKVDGPIGKFAG